MLIASDYFTALAQSMLPYASCDCSTAGHGRTKPRGKTGENFGESHDNFVTISVGNFNLPTPPIFLTVPGSPVTMQKYFEKRKVLRFVKSFGSISCQITEKSWRDIRNRFLALDFLTSYHPHHLHLCLECMTVCSCFELLTNSAAILAMSAGRCNQRNIEYTR